jgi:phage shock protein C
MSSNKRLYKSEDPVFAGVCGGIAEFFDFDPTLVRILTVVLVLAGFGLPIIAYFVAMILMPKKTAGYPDYIDVKPTAAASAAEKSGSSAPPPNAPPVAQAAAQTATATSAAGPANPGACPPTNPQPQPQPQPQPNPAPGSGYTACNPQAYDCHPEQDATGPQARKGMHTGVKLGILLVGVGILALVGTFVNVAVWRFWPLFIILIGLVTLCTPGREGWCLARAGSAISTITIGFALQLWTLGLFHTHVFFQTFFSFWPILLIIIGLIIIGNATEQSIFKLFGSLIFSLALLIGVWNFGLAGNAINIDLPGEYSLEIVIPSSGFNQGVNPE